MVRLCLPVAEWPAPDRRAWEAAHRRGGLLDDDGLGVDWAPATSSIIAGGYGRFLSFLTETGGLDPSQSPETRITRPLVEAYVMHLRERNHSSTVAARVLQLVQASRIMAPGTDWRWLRRIRSRLRRMSTPARDDRARLVPAATVTELHSDLAQRADEVEHLSECKRALLVRDALMLAMLNVCPMRAKTMAAMAIGTSLHRRGNEWWVAFASADMKNRRPFEAPLPGLTALIDSYVERYRPDLVARSTPPVAGNALWISVSGKPMSAKQIGQLVSRRTERELGRALNPHLFRKIVPTELAVNDPEHVGVAQPLLGHADYRTTERAYNLGCAIDAARRVHGVVRAVRATGAAPRQSGRREGRSGASTRPPGSPRLGTRNVSFKKG
jgi:site-specific recombinase XerD